MKVLADAPWAGSNRARRRQSCGGEASDLHATKKPRGRRQAHAAGGTSPLDAIVPALNLGFELIGSLRSVIISCSNYCLLQSVERA